MATKTKQTSEAVELSAMDRAIERAKEYEESQLGLFNYSQLSEPQIRKSLEIKGRMISIGKRVSADLLELSELAKEQHDNLNSYPLFIDWCNKELGYSVPMAKRFLRVGKNQGSYTTLNKIPDSLNGLDAIASALLKADSEEAKEQITQAINEATEKKGKALTEKEINELPQVKELKERLKAEQEAKKQAEEAKKKAEQTELDLTAKLAVVLNERDKLKATTENQTKQIQDLNSSISAKENQLKSIADKQKDLEEKEQDLNRHIEVKAKEKIEEKQKEIEKEKAKLKATEEQLKKELQEAQKIKTQIERDKERLNDANQWVTAFDLTNNFLVKTVASLREHRNNLERTPDLSELSEADQVKFKAKIQDLVVEFNTALHELGGQINYLNGAVAKFNNHALRVIDAEVENE